MFFGESDENEQFPGILSFSTGSLPNTGVTTPAKIKVCTSAVAGWDPLTYLGRPLVDILGPYLGSAVGPQTADFHAASNAVATFGINPSGGGHTASLSSTGC